MATYIEAQNGKTYVLCNLRLDADDFAQYGEFINFCFSEDSPERQIWIDLAAPTEFLHNLDIFKGRDELLFGVLRYYSTPWPTLDEEGKSIITEYVLANYPAEGGIYDSSDIHKVADAVEARDDW